MATREGTIDGPANFSSRADTPSGPVAFLTFISCSFFLTTFWFIDISVRAEAGRFRSLQGIMGLIFTAGPISRSATVLKYSLSNPAFSLSFVVRDPSLLFSGPIPRLVVVPACFFRSLQYVAAVLTSLNKKPWIPLFLLILDFLKCI